MAAPVLGAMLAETPSPVFLMSLFKPALTFAALVAYANLVTTRLLPDCMMLNFPSARWGYTYIGAATAALLAVLLVPWWWLGFPVMLAVLLAPCFMYVSYRTKELERTKKERDGRPVPPLPFFSIDLAKRMALRRAKAAQAGARLRFERKDRSEHPVPEKTDPAYPAFDALQNLVAAAIAARASRMDLALAKQGFQAQWIVDSVRSKATDVPGPDLAPKVAQLLKSYAGLKLDEQRKFQTGNVIVLSGEDRLELTVSSLGSMQGEVLRVDFGRKAQLGIRMVDLPDLPAGQEDRKKEPAAQKDEREMRLADLMEKGATPDPSFSSAQVKLLKGAWADARPGVVLFGARPGNGLTNLGLSILGLHDALTSNIQTLERRIELVIPGVEHQAYDPGKSDYATQLQSIVRRGPNVMMITEPGEPGVGKVVCGPASGETLFLIALPMDTPAEMIAAWAKIAGSVEAASGKLLATVSQRLVRTLCESCKTPHTPSAAELKMLLLPANKQIPLFRQSGKVLVKEQPVDCRACGGTGFIGVAAATEVLVLDDEARRLLGSGDLKGATLHARRTFRSKGLVDTAIGLVRGDTRLFRENDRPRFTSLDEVKRVFSASASAPPKAGTPAAGTPTASKPAAPGAAKATAASPSTPKPPATKP